MLDNTVVLCFYLSLDQVIVLAVVAVPRDFIIITGADSLAVIDGQSVSQSHRCELNRQSMRPLLSLLS